MRNDPSVDSGGSVNNTLRLKLSLQPAPEVATVSAPESAIPYATALGRNRDADCGTIMTFLGSIVTVGEVVVAAGAIVAVAATAAGVAVSVGPPRPGAVKAKCW